MMVFLAVMSILPTGVFACVGGISKAWQEPQRQHTCRLLDPSSSSLSSASAWGAGTGGPLLRLTPAVASLELICL